MTITGRQIREARILLRWDRSKLARRAALPLATIERAEASDNEAAVIVARQTAIQQALSNAGIEFTGDPPSVGLREGAP